MTEFMGYLLTEDETLALSELLKKIREEKERKALISKCKMAISFEISDAISRIGLDETKAIVRMLHEELEEYN